MISATSFINSYSWGDLTGDPVDFMVRWFDLHAYVPNRGTRRFMVRLPKRLVDVAALQKAMARLEHLASVKLTDEHVILDLSWTDEEPEYEWIDEESVLPALAPLRTELLDGDFRLAYLVWLKALELSTVADSLEVDEDEEVYGVSVGLIEPDDPEPMAGIGPVTQQLGEFSAFFQIDPDLIAAAAERCPVINQDVSPDAVRTAIARVPDDVRTDVLTRLHAGDPMVMTESRAALPRGAASAVSTVKPRTTAEVLSWSVEIRTAREKVEAERELAEQRRLAV